jgi:hypothetical protein
MKNEAEILNDALMMAMEWGENFGKPIQERLRAKYPALSQEEADEFERLCREMMYYAFGQIEEAYTKTIPDTTASANIKARYPLLNEESMGRLWSQGQYYAWRDHG